MKILIADDSSTIRRFIIKAVRLAKIPVTFVEAVDGTSCLEHLKSGQFDIAFVDVNMPGISGLEAVAVSRQEDHDTFVVVMSTVQNPDRLQLARSLGVYEYLAKPFKQEDIVGLLRNHARLKSVSSVLIIDDSSTIRGVIKRVMKNSSFSLDVEDVADGPAGMVAYQQKHHDIVFLDLNMPGISSLDTLSMLSKLNDNLKAILITTENNRDTIESINDPHVHGALYKPFYASDVDRVLHNLFGLKPPSLNAGPIKEETSLESEDDQDVILL